MVTIHPVPRALVPVDSAAASRISAPNYDEFQGDGEIWHLIREAPECVLSVTMAHCDVEDPADIGPGDSPAALARAEANLQRLRDSPGTREVRRVLYVYEIVDPRRPDVRQIGLGGMGLTAEIRTDATPNGPIIRNEGVREPKARGRARLIEATRSIIGTVNNAVPDSDGALARAVASEADRREPDFEVRDRDGNVHRIWLVTEPGAISRLQHVLAEQPEAYVADGNHRSAAAAMLGHEHFLTVFFPAATMGIAPYNRLVRLRSAEEDEAPVEGIEGPTGPPDGGGREAAAPGMALTADAVLEPLGASFDVHDSPVDGPYQPVETHRIGLYTALTGWVELTPHPASFDARDAAGSIDHDIVQRRLFEDVWGIEDPGDDRLTFVGANRDAAWLEHAVDGGRADAAVTLPAVTMDQFIAVCRQGKMMPPKSTWFVPKIRSGLVMALLDD